jgi:hypothetical protein
MDEEIKELKGVLRTLAADARTGAHLPADTLVAYHSDELSPDEDERTREHLSVCRECTSLLLDLDAAVAREANVSDLPSQAEIDPIWRKLRDRHFPPPSSRDTPRPAKTPLSQRLRGLFALPRPAYVLAIFSLAVSLALAVWVASLIRERRDMVVRLNERPSSTPARDDSAARESLDAARRETEEARREAEAAKRLADEAQRQRDEALARADQLEARAATPRRGAGAMPSRSEPNVEIVELIMPTRANNERQQSVVLPAGVSHFTLSIETAPQWAEKYSIFTLKIFNSRNVDVESVEALRVNERGSLTTSVLSQKLPAGRYIFRVYGISRGTETQVLEREVVISYR